MIIEREICRVLEPTKDGMVYSRDFLLKEIARLNYIVGKRYFKGELSSSTPLPGSICIDWGNLSHTIIELRLTNNVLVAIIETIPTSAGKELKALLENGMKVDFNIHGVGDTQEVVVGEKTFLVPGKNYIIIQIYACVGSEETSSNEDFLEII